MPKYNFHELKAKSNTQELPEDINSQIEHLAETLEDNGGVESLKKYRENRWFGHVIVWDKKKLPVATAFFDHGICFRYEITTYSSDGRPLAVLSVKNEKLDDRKKGV